MEALGQRLGRFEASGDDFELSPPPVECLRLAVRHDNGDLTICGPQGTARLEFESEVWRRYRRYLWAALGSLGDIR
jgi:hypothetical protein